MITGTFNGASIVAFPTSIAPKSVEFTVNDAVAIVTSPFTGQTQTQQWPGADSLTGTVTLPPLTQPQADEWLSFLMQLRGMANCFLFGDPMKHQPAGNPRGSQPVADMSVSGTNYAGAQTLYTRGWVPSAFGLLHPGDYIQIGNRLHRVLDRVNADGNGHAQLSIWPSLREVPTDGEAIILNNPRGMFRLAQNKRTWSSDATLLTAMSFQILEYR